VVVTRRMVMLSDKRFSSTGGKNYSPSKYWLNPETKPLHCPEINLIESAAALNTNLVADAISATTNVSAVSETVVVNVDQLPMEEIILTCESLAPSTQAAIGAVRNYTEELSLSIATVAGSTLLGLTVGGLMDGIIAGGRAPILPIFEGAAAAATAFWVMDNEELYQSAAYNISRTVIGKPVLIKTTKTLDEAKQKIESFVSPILETIDNSIDTVTNLPSTIQSTTEKKLEEFKASSSQYVSTKVEATVNYANSIPENIKNTIKRRIQRAFDSVKYFAKLKMEKVKI
jgi:hypothetical protein